MSSAESSGQQNSIQKNGAYVEAMQKKLKQTGEVLDYELRTTEFSNAFYPDHQLMAIMRQMIMEVHGTRNYHVPVPINAEKLDRFLVKVWQEYNMVPYHCFSHGFMTAQMANVFIWKCDLEFSFSCLDLVCLLTSALCHDIDHSGLSSDYHIKMETELYQQYNTSPLEHYHYSKTAAILSTPEYNFIDALEKDKFDEFLYLMKELMLATDFSRHHEICRKFSSIKHFNVKHNNEHRLAMLKMIMKVSDLSSELRPLATMNIWLERLFTESLTESEKLRAAGHEVPAKFDRQTFKKGLHQVNFINNVSLPLVKEICRALPKMKRSLEDPLKENLQYFMDLKDQEAVDNYAP